MRRGAEALHQAIVDLRRIPYPVIAAVNGPAAGAGFSLALACDIRIASEDAFFACAYGRIGASPDGGMTYFLPRVVGPSRALEILLDDPNMSAEDALAERLVTEVVAGRGADGAGAGEGREAGREGAPLRADGEDAVPGRASRTASPSTCSWSATGSPTAWRPRTCATGVEAFFGGEQPGVPAAAEPGVRAARIRDYESSRLVPSGKGTRHEEGSRPARPRPRRARPGRLRRWRRQQHRHAADDGEHADRRRRRRRRRQATAAAAGGGGGDARRSKPTRAASSPTTTDDATAKAGKVTIDFTTRPRSRHDVAIEDSGGKTLGKTDLITDGIDLDDGRT